MFGAYPEALWLDAPMAESAGSREISRFYVVFPPTEAYTGRSTDVRQTGRGIRGKGFVIGR
jgi:hypothetical protein